MVPASGWPPAGLQVRGVKASIRALLGSGKRRSDAVTARRVCHLCGEPPKKRRYTCPKCDLWVCFRCWHCSQCLQCFTSDHPDGLDVATCRLGLAEPLPTDGRVLTAWDTRRKRAATSRPTVVATPRDARAHAAGIRSQRDAQRTKAQVERKALIERRWDAFAQAWPWADHWERCERLELGMPEAHRLYQDLFERWCGTLMEGSAQPSPLPAIRHLRPNRTRADH